MDRLNYLIDNLPPEGHPDRDRWEELIADVMFHAGVIRHRGWTRRADVSVRIIPGCEADARRWVDQLGEVWPTRRLHAGLKKIIARALERGEPVPEELFDWDDRWGIRPARPTTLVTEWARSTTRVDVG